MSFKSLAVCAAVLLSCAAPASAQAVRLRFHDGLVTLNTQNAPLRAILTEWARQGGATILNAERVSGPPMSLELNAVPERQALDVLLRTVSGYIAAPRAAGSTSVAVFDRIVILPTSTAPANVPPTAAAGRGFPQPRPGVGMPRPVMPQPPIVPDPEELEEEPPQDVPPDEQEEPTLVTPQVRPRPGVQLPRGMVPGLLPPGQPFEIPEQEPEPEPEPDEEPAVATPGNPFGIPAGATSRPGVVTPVPRGQQERAPREDPDP
jgi:hypothetical protein